MAESIRGVRQELAQLRRRVDGRIQKMRGQILSAYVDGDTSLPGARGEPLLHLDPLRLEIDEQAGPIQADRLRLADFQLEVAGELEVELDQPIARDQLD